MQSLAVYSLETKLDLAEADARLAGIDSVIDTWLAKKGAIDPRVSDGSFESKSGDGLGQFSRKSIEISADENGVLVAGGVNAQLTARLAPLDVLL